MISATNADLPAMIEDGAFRADLYYRLNTIEIALPSLADRPEDILPLAEAFLPPGRTLSQGACNALRKHSWPGNVRELRNSAATRRAAGRRAPRSRSPTCSSIRFPRPWRRGAPEPDRDDIESALAQHDGVVARAAAELGLSRQALYRRMEKLGIARA